MLLAPAIILAFSLLAGGGYLAHDITRGRRAALLGAVRDNPADYVHARLNEEAPHQFDLNRQVEQRQAELTDALQKETALGKELPSNPPPRPWVVKILAFSGLWLIAFTVQFLLDYRIAKAITGNTGAAALTALIISGLLSATTLAASMLWEKRASLGHRHVVLGLIAAAALLCAVISGITQLAPKRAYQDYASQIDSTEQQLTMYKDDGDKTAISLTQTKLARLETQRRQATTFYQATAVAAGLLEGGTSLAVPAGYTLINFYGAQSLVRRRRKEVTKAQHAVARRRERFAARMSRTLERAGVSQDRLGPLLTRTGAQAPTDNAPQGIARRPAPVAGPPTPPAGGSGVPGQRPPAGPQHPASTGSPNPGRNEDAPDPSFDQA